MGYWSQGWYFKFNMAEVVEEPRRDFILLGTRAFSAPGLLVKLSLLVYSRSQGCPLGL